MRCEHDDEQRLLSKIDDQIAHIEAFLRRARPRQARLTVITIVSAALAAALTAGPALGGTDFTKWAVDDAALAKDPSYVWRALCLLAMLVSITAAICANLNQASKTGSRIISAEVCKTELVCLQTLIEFHQVPLAEGLKLYQQHLARVPFLDQPQKPAAPPDFSWDLQQEPGGGGPEPRTTRASAVERTGQSTAFPRPEGNG